MKQILKLALAAGMIAAPAMATAQAPVSAPQFVRMAGASDLYERTSSQIMLQSTRNPRVREFARMMVRDHARSSAEMMRAARRSGVRVMPPRLAPEQARMVAELRRTRPMERDRIYVAQQRTAHEKTLALMEEYARAGRAVPLRRVASMTVPIVQHHLEMLRGM